MIAPTRMFQEAGEAPRFRHSSNGLALESAISPEARFGLDARGHRLITTIGAFYSRSKQPKWRDADGKEVESKVDLGRMGFFRGDRNWLILLTAGDPLIIRLEDSNLKAVLPAVQERTGVAVKR